MLTSVLEFISWRPMHLNVGEYFFAIARYAFIVLPLELLWGQQSRSRILSREYWTDFVHMTTLVLLASLTLAPVIYLFAPVLNEIAHFLSPLHISSLPIWLQILIVLLIGDLFAYGFHYWSHANDFLWRFHSVHHSSKQLDWMAGFRLHIIDYSFIRICFMFPAWVLATSPSAGFWTMIVIQFFGFFQHTKLHIRFYGIERLLMTPYMHHWHHEIDTSRHSNFTHIFPFIDRMFGTLKLPTQTAWPKTYGDLDNTMSQTSYVAQQLSPFRPQPLPEEKNNVRILER